MVVSGRSRLQLILSTCFAAVAAIGAFGTLAWVTGQLILARINPLFIPIAPLTIILLVLLGTSWFLYGLRPEHAWSRVQAGAVGILVVILTLLTIYQAVMPGSFNIEALVFPNPATFQGYPLGRMSPLTAVMFLLGGLSLILPFLSSETRSRTTVALFGIAILSCGIATSIGYLYQAPLLYGGPIIPVSIPTAIAFLFLGTEIWAAAGQECWPTRDLVGDTVQARLLRTLLPVVALLLVSLVSLDEVLGSIYVASLVAALELLLGLAAVVVIIERLSRGIGGEIDKGIVERAQMQKALQESEEKYRAMVENSPNMIGIFQDGIMKYVNSGAIRKLGWSYEELVSPSFNPIENVVSQKSRSMLKENIGRRLRGENFAPYEITLTKKDGSELQVLVRGVKIVYNQKPAIEFVFDDVTERKMAEANLRQSEERYHSLFDGMLDGVYRTTHEGRFVDVNPAFVKMFGYSTKQEMLDIADIKKELYFSPEERASHFLDTGQEKEEVFRMRRKDESEIWVEDHGRYVHDEHGNVIYHEGTLRDVTERVRSERALSESEERYYSLFDQMLDGVYRSTPDGRFVDVNPAFVKMFGYSTKQEMLDIADIKKELYFSPEERGSHILDTGREEVEVYRMRRKDESEIWVEDHGRYVHDEQGNIIFHEGLLRDVTERMRSQRALSESEKRYRSLFERMLEGFAYCKMILDDDGRAEDFVFLDVNPAFSRLTGLESVVGKRVTEVIPGIKKDNPELFDIYGRVALTGKSEKFEADLKSLGISLAVSVSSARKGEFVTVFENITARKNMQRELEHYSKELEGIVEERTEKLRSATEQLDLAVSSNPAVVFVGKSLPDMSDFLATYISKNAVSVLGFEAEALIGQSGADFWESRLSPEDVRKYREEVPALWRDGHHAFEYRFLHKDGKYRWIHEEMRLIKHEKGQPFEVAGYWTDVTDRKSLEERLHTSQRLAAIGETAAMVGHDLRNPLQGIAGAAFNIRRGLGNSTNPSTTEMLEVIENGVQYANGIISDLLEYSREMQIQPVPTTPSSIARQALTDVKVPSNIAIENTTTDGPEVLADEPKIRRVILNLVQNAIEAMPEGGRLSISSSYTQRELLMSVSDTGSGIPKETVDRIWTGLFTTKAKGIGLGLPICRRIVEAHGGSLSVVSTVGNGTTFTLKLPIQRIQVEVKHYE